MTNRMEGNPKPFHVHVEDAVLQDLKNRLGNTRWIPDDFDEQGKHYGQDRAIQRELVRYWLEEYDWRKYEREINSFSNYKMKVDGLEVHFIHETSPSPDAVPIILVHGWPGSFWEFHKVIPKLVQGEDQGSFHVVVPSIPGYGFSEAAKEPGMNITKVARIFDELMKRLGYDRYVAQGGDWGAIVTKQMAIQFPYNCVCLHQNMPTWIPLRPSFKNLLIGLQSILDFSPLGRLTLSAGDKTRVAKSLEYVKSGIAYLILQSSKPHTQGDALADSPAGLLSWITEKKLLWADTRENGLFAALSKDEIITNVMIYWVTNSIASSMRFYFESIPIGKRGSDTIERARDDRVRVPTALALFPEEAIAFPLKWLKMEYNVVQHTEFTKGGHFAAWEQPELFAEDVRRFIFQTLPFDRACQLAEERRAEDLHKEYTPLLDSAVVLTTVAAISSYLFRRG